MHGSSTGFQQARRDPSDGAFKQRAARRGDPLSTRRRGRHTPGVTEARASAGPCRVDPACLRIVRMVNVAMSRHLADIVRSFKNYKALGDAALAQVPDEYLHTEIDPNSNSLAVIVKHVGGNLRSRFRDFLTTDGEKPDRDRDGEFEMREPATREQILGWWNDGWAIALASIEALLPEDLDR